MGVIELQIQIFLLLVIGYVLAKKGMFSKQTQNQLTNMILIIILPCSIIQSFQLEINKEIISSAGIVLIASFGIQIVYHFLNKFLYNKMDKDKQICCKYGTMVSNAGFMGMPIAAAMFKAEGLLYASIFLLPQRIFMWSSGLALFASINKKDVPKQVLSHPCIIAIYIGIITLILKQFNIILPNSVMTTISLIGQSNTSLSMFVIGGILADINKNEIFDKDALYYCFNRLLMIPMLILIVLTLVNIPTVPNHICVLLSAMPAASTTVMLAQKYNKNVKFASKLLFISTVGSLITLPIFNVLFTMIG